jgi:DNA polymerase IV
MEPALKDKIAFFDRLKSLQDDDDEADSIAIEKDIYRAKSKAFAATRASLKANKSHPQHPKISAIGNPGVGPRRTASDPTPKKTQREDITVIVIEDTPQPSKSVSGQPTAASLAKAISSIEFTPIPDSTRRPSALPNKSTTNPVLRSTSQALPLPAEDSPSINMGKRKREEKLKMAPVALQYFKGLSLFYIPNDDVDPARKRRIIRAKEHGANWVRNIDQATHVIVDDKFSYKDIDKILATAPSSMEKTIVNDGYPIDCIAYRRLLNPDQQQYQIPGFPQGTETTLTAPPEASTVAPGPAQTSDKSLQRKPKRNASRRWENASPADTSPRSAEYTPLSANWKGSNVITSSQLQDYGSLDSIRKSASPERQLDAEKRHDEVDSQGPLRHGNEVSATLINDELSQCINEVRGNPGASLDNDGEDSDGDDSDEERWPSSVDGGVVSSPIEIIDSDSEAGGSDEEPATKRKRLSGEGPVSKQKEIAWQDKFACMTGGTKGENKDNPNAKTIEVLQEMCDWYTRNNEQFRILAYRKAIAALRQQTTKITTYEEARAITTIGERLAHKIEEIVRTGRLRRLEEAMKEPNHEVRELFLKIYGVGLKQANKWIHQGYRTLDDLRSKVKLNEGQLVGIEHFDDLNTRIPRKEVEALGNCVKRAAHSIDARVELLIGGSYRRGSDSSGDIDMIITKKGTTSSTELVPFLSELIKRLSSQEFFTASLASVRSANGSKWHGCCVLPKDDFPGEQSEYRPVWRRIDLLLVPETEYGAALIYFTGNDIFNRSMRLLALKKGMRLNQRGLYSGVMRGPGGITYNEGDLVEGRDEKKIFKALGVQWRAPHQRWCG